MIKKKNIDNKKNDDKNYFNYFISLNQLLYNL